MDNGTNILLWNAKDVRGEKAELLGIINKYDIICITETKLNKSCYLHFTGYRGTEEIQRYNVQR